MGCMNERHSHVIAMMTVLFILLNGVDGGASINDTRTLLADLKGTYNKDIRPVDDQDNILDVSSYVFLKAIKEFDEVQGTLSFTGALLISWNDTMMRWNPALYGGAYMIRRSYSDVWVPDLILVNPAEDANTLGKPWQMITYYANGEAYWNPGGLIKTTCDINVRYYPFDSQTCDAQFIAWGYYNHEIRINGLKDMADTSSYSPHPSWDLVSTSFEPYNFSVVIPGIVFKLTLKRKPEFVIVNIILPILFLSLLNVLVFVLVPDSGERISFSITVLLSIAVFMTIVSDTLPKSSEPIPLISYKLMMDMILSSLITLMTIITLHFYHKTDDTEVPVRVQAFYRFLMSCWCRKSSQTAPIPFNKPQSVSHIKFESKPSDVLTISEEGSPNESSIEDRLSELVANLDSVPKPKVTWKQISQILDRICLITFTILSSVSFLYFLLISTLI